MNVNPLLQIKALGQSIWLDYIQRNMLKNGEIARMIEEDGLAGITSNPAIFEKAINEHHDYDEAITSLAHRGMPPKEIYEALALEDVARTADLFRPLYDESNGRDGFVSLEVSPHLAYDTQQTISEAERLWATLNRPNVLIKVPATQAGLPAITHLLAAGININVTILFSLERYRQVVDAFLAGLETRVAQHKPVDHITSVASFFLSRIDVLVDKRLDELVQITGDKSVGALRGKAAIACARLAYQHYQQWIKDNRWQSLSSHDARAQRLLWASTGTKDPAYNDTKYVEPLIAKDTINTMPLETLNAYRDHGQPAVRIEQELDESGSLLEKLHQIGIDLEAVGEQLEGEGVQKFSVPFDKLLERIKQW